MACQLDMPWGNQADVQTVVQRVTFGHAAGLPGHADQRTRLTTVALREAGLQLPVQVRRRVGWSLAQRRAEQLEQRLDSGLRSRLVRAFRRGTGHLQPAAPVGGLQRQAARHAQ